MKTRRGLLIGTGVRCQLLTCELRNVSGMRSVAVGSGGKARAGAALAKPNAKSRCTGCELKCEVW